VKQKRTRKRLLRKGWQNKHCQEASKTAWTPKPELVRDVINGVCHQRYRKRLEQRKSDPKVIVNAADESFKEEL